ncbi:hypothetical protein CCUS01_09764 [Colletotrichum cuscutae]|uniref:Uncharacterized protein n=1 Tax=Colletotrichum cuscutae TaxID=1209917 RepID=A0AAI9UG08_9PEZI|nr:hypothetical protein CCUS01_09764 [Colletotrichum cuscutae]
MTSQRALQCAENKSVASAKRDEATALSLASLRMGKFFFLEKLGILHPSTPLVLQPGAGWYM